jgi:hypothetical protein
MAVKFTVNMTVLNLITLVTVAYILQADINECLLTLYSYSRVCERVDHQFDLHSFCECLFIWPWLIHLLTSV